MKHVKVPYDPNNKPPCDSCIDRKACRVNALACDAFNSWAEHGAVKAIHAERYQPTRAGLMRV